MKKRLTFNPETGLETIFHDEGDKIYIETRQDVSKDLKFNEESRKAHTNYLKKGVEHYHIAHIPDLFITKIKNEYGLDIFNPEHQEDVKKKILNNPDYAFLRTTPGTV